MVRSRRRLWLELSVVAGAGALSLLVQRFGGARLPAAAGTWLIPAVFLYAPSLAGFVGRDFSGMGLERPAWRKAMLDLTLFLFVVLPIFLLSWLLLMTYGMGSRFAPDWPRDLGSLLVWQLAGVALPEEVFFRGFMQGRFNELFTRRITLLGAAVGPGLFLAAALFALAHFLVIPRPIQLLVFFPGLLFGLLRERSGSVFTPMVAHALANVTFLVVQNWRVR